MAPLSPLCIILAAGAGSRMGGPKLFARVKNRFFHEHILGTLNQLAWPSLWVLRSEDQARQLNPENRVSFCFNRDPDSDMFHSIVCALQSKNSLFFNTFLIWPVDFPLVRPDTLQDLEAHSRKTDVAFPVFMNRPGHPVLISRHALVRMVSSLPSHGLQQALGNLSTRRFLMPCPDEGVCRNLNSPADLPPEEKSFRNYK